MYVCMYMHTFKVSASKHKDACMYICMHVCDSVDARGSPKPEKQECCVGVYDAADEPIFS